MENYYEILQIDYDATLDDIRKAYYKQLKKYHPDVYSGDNSVAEAMTSKLINAYNELKKDNVRAELRHEYGRYRYNLKQTKQAKNKEINKNERINKLQQKQQIKNSSKEEKFAQKQKKEALKNNQKQCSTQLKQKNKNLNKNLKYDASILRKPNALDFSIVILFLIICLLFLIYYLV